MAEKTQAEIAYMELSNRILIQEIAPKNRIVEQFWSKKLQVNRAAIRESLTRLLGEDLVCRGSRGGYFVREMTPSEIHEVREIREILETSAFSMACDRASAKEIKDIEETCNDFANFVQKSYFTAALEADLRFHRLLIAAAGNARLTHLYERCNLPLFQRRSFNTRMHLDDYIATEKEHRLILGSLQRRDKKAGIQHLKDHFNRGEEAAVA